jgi:hypothetical protein
MDYDQYTELLEGRVYLPLSIFPVETEALEWLLKEKDRANTKGESKVVDASL